MRWERVDTWTNSPLRVVALVAGLFLMLVAVGAVAWHSQQLIQGDPFTEFYVLGAQNTLQDYPTNLREGKVQDYNVGVVNHEGDIVNYVIRAFLGNTEVGSLGPLPLEDGATWEGKLNVTPAMVGDQQELELRLYRDTGTEVYRTLHLFVDVREP